MLEGHIENRTRLQMEVPRWCRGLRISGVAAAVVQVASAVARVRFLVQELLHVEGVKKKKKKCQNRRLSDGL